MRTSWTDTRSRTIRHTRLGRGSSAGVSGVVAGASITRGVYAVGPKPSPLGSDPGRPLHLTDRAVAVLLCEKTLADPIRLRRDLEQLVVGEELDRVV
jgi:hypothetical protein